MVKSPDNDANKDKILKISHTWREYWPGIDLSALIILLSKDRSLSRNANARLPETSN